MDSKLGKKMKKRLDKKIQTKRKQDEDQQIDKRRFNIFGETSNFIIQSKFSCCLYFIGIIVCFQYFVFLSYTTMIARNFDDTSSTQMKIDQKNIGNITFFDDDVFIFPFIDIDYTGGSKRQQDIKTNSRFDYEKIKNYFQIQISINTKRKGKSSRYFRSDFMNCKIDQFKDLKLSKSQMEDISENIHRFFCLDKNKLKSDMILQNGYSANDRISFSIEIVSCMQGKNCHSEDQVKSVLSDVYFTQYMVRKQVDFKKDDQNDREPTIKDIQYFQQFMIGIDKYIDNNNFLRKNIIETKDNVISSLMGNYEYQYYDIIQKPTWSTTQRFYNKHTYTTYDNINYFYQERQIYYGSYYFLDNEILIHEKQVYTIAQFISEIGGMFSIIFTCIELIVCPMIYRFNIGHIINIVNKEAIEDKNTSDQQDNPSSQQDIFTTQFKINQPNDPKNQNCQTGQQSQQKLESSHNFRRSIFINPIDNKMQNIQESDVEFTFLDQLNNLILFKPFFKLLKKTPLVKNYKNYNKLKNQIEEEIQIYKIVQNNQKLYRLASDFKQLKKDLELQKQNQPSSQEDKSIDLNDIQISRIIDLNQNSIVDSNKNINIFQTDSNNHQNYYHKQIKIKNKFSETNE